MKRSCSAVPLTLVACALLGMSARAQESTPPALPSASPHTLSGYFTSQGLVYLSDARTMGGLGLGVGVRDVLDTHYVLQADVSYLAFVGNSAAVRLGAGVQLGRTYNPAALVTLTAQLGQQLSFLTEAHATPIRAPAFSGGVLLAPLRFDFHETQVSILQVGIGAGTDLPGLGLCVSVGLLEIGSSF
jgi:hypothetical protein